MLCMCTRTVTVWHNVLLLIEVKIKAMHTCAEFAIPNFAKD